MSEKETTARDQPVRGPRILFRSQLVLMVAFTIFVMVFSFVLTCGKKQDVIGRPEQRNEIRR
jgi:hypothetical protein